jgi:hypothetical protein
MSTTRLAWYAAQPPGRAAVDREPAAASKERKTIMKGLRELNHPNEPVGARGRQPFLTLARGDVKYACFDRARGALAAQASQSECPIPMAAFPKAAMRDRPNCSYP